MAILKHPVKRITFWFPGSAGLKAVVFNNIKNAVNDEC
jgi:hypothetical protein